MSPLSTPLSPLAFLARSSTAFRTKLAVVDGDRRWSFEDLATSVQQFAEHLTACGLQPGDRVAMIAPNSAELLIAHFAVPTAGGVLVTLNTRMAPPEILAILEHCEAAYCFVDPAHTSRLPTQLPESLQVFLLPDAQGQVTPSPTPGVRDWGEFTAAALDDITGWPDHSEQDLISINYTSGTTGRPKGVMYNHRGAALNALSQIHHQALDCHSVYLWTLPMFHCNGWCVPWAAVGTGATQVCLRAVTCETVWNLVNREGVTHLCGAPTVLNIIANGVAGRELRHPLTVTTAGAAPTPGIIERLVKLGLTVIPVYGLTESYGPYTVCEPQTSWSNLPTHKRARLMARQGVSMLTAEPVRVITTDDSMTDVPADGTTVGEIVLRGNTVTSGYFRDKAATAAAFRGGWFHTGDLAVMHPDGYIEIVDRAKDLIISGGENVSTIEVEQTLAAHPAVDDVAVVGHPDEYWGEIVVAYVVATTSVEAEALRSFARSSLAGFKIPKRIHFVNQLPMTSTGKVMKQNLREHKIDSTTTAPTQSETSNKSVGLKVA